MLEAIDYPIGAQMALSFLWRDRNYKVSILATVCDARASERRFDPATEAETNALAACLVVTLQRGFP
jgi:hypothetical protein